MTSSESRLLKVFSILLAMAGLFSPAVSGSVPTPLHVEATLVWGARQEPKGKKLQPVSQDLQAKLRNSLRWEHYYRINHKSLDLSSRKAQRVRMSDKCEVEVRRIKPDLLNVKLIGEGKVVVNKRHSLSKDDAVVMGGPCEDKSAWFVVLQFK